MTGPLLLTLEVGVLATALATACALGLIYATQGRRVARVLDAVLTAPLVLPPTVLGFYLLSLLGSQGLPGRAWERLFGEPLVFTFKALVVAATLTALPFVLQGARAALDSVDGALLEAARTLGATRWKAFRRVALPLASRGIASGVLLGFARACGDFGVTLMLAGSIPGKTQTASLALYDAVLAQRDDDARVLAAVLAGVAVLAILAVQRLGSAAHAR